jgi:ribosomal protein L7/L12
MSSDVELRRRVRELERKVDFLLEHLELTYESKPTDGVSQAVIDLIWQGKKIEAVKRVREEGNLGLKEAKDIVDELERQYKGR